MNDSKLPILPLFPQSSLGQMKRKSNADLPEGLELLLRVLENNCRKEMYSSRGTEQSLVSSPPQVLFIDSL